MLHLLIFKAITNKSMRSTFLFDLCTQRNHLRVYITCEEANPDLLPSIFLPTYFQTLTSHCNTEMLILQIHCILSTIAERTAIIKLTDEQKTIKNLQSYYRALKRRNKKLPHLYQTTHLSDQWGYEYHRWLHDTVNRRQYHMIAMSSEQYFQ